ncbi:hypothetical protein BJ508DRAFT_331417 [Ascobolus immersus RN42]|uniref:Uncharacterized protein n=1 Tax=Ascobolus immersus RN42 TaxID=1160509 RepID=A0A3N4I2P8_ASCIM|nr:hypothetical protein BJ508DRAFT_331417 [Ascobolus immersus RN42]
MDHRSPTFLIASLQHYHNSAALHIPPHLTKSRTSLSAPCHSIPLTLVSPIIMLDYEEEPFSDDRFQILAALRGIKLELDWIQLYELERCLKSFLSATEKDSPADWDHHTKTNGQLKMIKAQADSALKLILQLRLLFQQDYPAPPHILEECPSQLYAAVCAVQHLQIALNELTYQFTQRGHLLSFTALSLENAYNGIQNLHQTIRHLNVRFKSIDKILNGSYRNDSVPLRFEAVRFPDQISVSVGVNIPERLNILESRRFSESNTSGLGLAVGCVIKRPTYRRRPESLMERTSSSQPQYKLAKVAKKPRSLPLKAGSRRRQVEPLRRSIQEYEEQPYNDDLLQILSTLGVIANEVYWVNVPEWEEAVGGFLASPIVRSSEKHLRNITAILIHLTKHAVKAIELIAELVTLFHIPPLHQSRNQPEYLSDLDAAIFRLTRLHVDAKYLGGAFARRGHELKPTKEIIEKAYSLLEGLHRQVRHTNIDLKRMDMALNGKLRRAWMPVLFEAARFPAHISVAVGKEQPARLEILEHRAFVETNPSGIGQQVGSIIRRPTYASRKADLPRNEPNYDTGAVEHKPMTSSLLSSSRSPSFSPSSPLPASPSPSPFETPSPSPSPPPPSRRRRRGVHDFDERPFTEDAMQISNYITVLHDEIRWMDLENWKIALDGYLASPKAQRSMSTTPGGQLQKPDDEASALHRAFTGLLRIHGDYLRISLEFKRIGHLWETDLRKVHEVYDLLLLIHRGIRHSNIDLKSIDHCLNGKGRPAHLPVQFKATRFPASISVDVRAGVPARLEVLEHREFENENPFKIGLKVGALVRNPTFPNKERTYPGIPADYDPDAEIPKPTFVPPKRSKRKRMPAFFRGSNRRLATRKK